MNTYELKIAQKKERYSELAGKAFEKSDTLYERAKGMSEIIPFGQPILVGHHSEGRDRRYRSKITSTFEKAFAEGDKAKYYERKAETVGTAGISSDDPEAIQKLEIKLARLEDYQRDMREKNAEARALKLEKPFMAYQLSNNSANIRSTKKRIEQLEKQSKIILIQRAGEGWEMKESAEENRIMFIFPGKPEEKIRYLLKSRAFKWSPTRGAWVRMISNNARYAAKMVIEELTKLEG